MSTIPKLLCFVLVCLMAFGAVDARAQCPPTENINYPLTIQIPIGSGNSYQVTEEMLRTVHDPCVEAYVKLCDFYVSPTNMAPRYGDLSWAGAANTSFVYTLNRTWEDVAEFTCTNGYTLPDDRIWYIVADGDNCNNAASYVDGYVRVEFICDTNATTPLVRDTDYCDYICLDDEGCIALTDVFAFNYANQCEALAGNTATPNVDLWIETTCEFAPCGQRFEVIDNQGRIDQVMTACYTAGTDCITFKKVNDSITDEDMVNNSPYSFTYTVTNAQGGRASANVVVEMPCVCCARLVKDLNITAIEWDEDPTTLEFDQVVYLPCPDETNFTHELSVVTDTQVLSDFLTSITGKGGYDWTGTEPPPATMGRIEKLEAEERFDYYPENISLECCDAMDYFYIRVQCLSNALQVVTNGSVVTTNVVAVPVTEAYAIDSGKQEYYIHQVKVDIINTFRPGTLAPVSTGNPLVDHYWFNSWSGPSSTPCDDISGGWSTICQDTTNTVPVRDLICRWFTTSNCLNDIYLDSIYSDANGQNSSELGGTVYVMPGDQADIESMVKYIPPEGLELTAPVTDSFHYVVGDYGDPTHQEHAEQTAYIVLSPCTSGCEPDPTPLVIDVCMEGQTNWITAAQMTAPNVLFDADNSTCGYSNFCVESISPTECSVGDCEQRPCSGDICFGTYRINYTTNCVAIPCDECISELLYIALDPAFVQVGVDMFEYVVSAVKDGVTNYITNEIVIIVRPVAPDVLAAVDVTGNDVWQDEVEAIAYDSIADIYSQCTGYGTLPIQMAFETTSAEGGEVQLLCTTNVYEPEGQQYVYYMGECMSSCDTCHCLPPSESGSNDYECALIYTPPAGFIGTDTITYRIWDGTLEECGGDLNYAEGTVTVTVMPHNLAPRANDDQFSIMEDELLTSSMLESACVGCGQQAAGILNNDWWPPIAENNFWTDVQNWIEVELVSSVQNGTLNFVDAGSAQLWAFGYRPAAGFVGVDSFTYRIYDKRSSLYSQPATVTIVVTPDQYVQHDYDGDGAADPGVVGPQGTWYVGCNLLIQDLMGLQWGWGDTIPAPGDYDGDMIGDVATYYPVTGDWYILYSDDGSFDVLNWGWVGAVPVPADYTGDGVTELAVYAPATGEWYVDADGYGPMQWGWSGAVPVPGDYDGDGAAEMAVYDVANGDWYINYPMNSALPFMVNWGWAAAEPVPADYDGDGDVELAVFDPSTLEWYIHPDPTPQAIMLPLGAILSNPVAVPADYDGDGEADLAIYDAVIGGAGTGIWYFEDGTTVQWGYEGAWPVSSAPGLYGAQW
ncbi:MAG: VCBS repeat-containing protein [Spartobacteria bacterium]|nr:VCBS repeat-containing protein [Spartobacteria bacterium]